MNCTPTDLKIIRRCGHGRYITKYKLFGHKMRRHIEFGGHHYNMYKIKKYQFCSLHFIFSNIVGEDIIKKNICKCVINHVMTLLIYSRGNPFTNIIDLIYLIYYYSYSQYTRCDHLSG